MSFLGKHMEPQNWHQEFMENFMPLAGSFLCARGPKHPGVSVFQRFPGLSWHQTQFWEQVAACK